MSKKDFKIQDSVSGKQSSSFQKYMDMVIGSSSIVTLIKFELIMLFVSRLPGAIGLLLRSKLYPMILGECGHGVVFGSNIVFRHPKKIKIGNNVIIDDNVLIDAKGQQNDGIVIKDEVFVGRNSIVSCKDGNLLLDERANISYNCVIYSSSDVKIGKDTIIAAYCYVVGGGNYKLDRIDIPISHQPDFEGKGGVVLEDDTWLGAHCVVLDGVNISTGSVIAAGAIVNKSVPELSICAGVPSKVIKKRI